MKTKMKTKEKIQQKQTKETKGNRQEDWQGKKMKAEGKSGVAEPPHSIGEVKWVFRKDVRPDPEQPRKTFDAEKLQGLAESIKAVGIRAPLQVEVVNGLELLEPDLVEKDWRVKDGKNPRTFANEGLAREFVAKADRDDSFYQIVDGERRWRAAELAGVERIPVMIVDTSSPNWEKEKLAIQLVLNQQHENVTALEEAGAYQKEIESGRHTAESLYPALGISRGTLFSRLALNRVHDDVRKALLEGKINTSVAGLMAMVPNADIEETLDAFANGEYGSGQMSFREAQEYIEKNCAKQLKSAVFDTKDGELVPEEWGAVIGDKTVTWTGRPDGVSLTPSLRAHTGNRTDDDGMGHKKTIWGVWSGEFGMGEHKQIAAEMSKPDAQALADYINHGNAGLLRRAMGGACTDCPMRSGNMEGCGLKNPNVCTEPKCFNAKEAAHKKAVLAQAVEKGKTVLPANKSGGLFSKYRPADLEYNAPYVKPGAKCEADKKGRTYAEIVGETVPVVHALNAEGTLVPLMDKEAVVKALKAVGVKVDQAANGYAEEQRKTKEKVKRLETAAVAAVKELLELVKGEKESSRFLRMVGHQLCSRYGYLERNGWKNEAGLKKALAPLSEAELRVTITQVLAEDPVDVWGGEFSTLFEGLCEAYGVDLKAHVAAQKEKTKKNGDDVEVIPTKKGVGR